MTQISAKNSNVMKMEANERGREIGEKIYYQNNHEEWAVINQIADTSDGFRIAKKHNTDGSGHFEFYPIINEKVKFATYGEVVHGITDSGRVFLWIFDELLDGWGWMPIVEVFESQQQDSTHRLKDYYFNLPLSELNYVDFAFEKYIEKNAGTKVERV